MTTTAPFKVHPWNVARNDRTGRDVRVLPALQPDGSPAIALMANGRLLLVLSQEYALKLSDSVVDALEEAGAHD